MKKVWSVKLPRGGFGDAEVNDLGQRHAVVQGDEDVGGFDVAVNDAFLMRVLDGAGKPG